MDRLWPLQSNDEMALIGWRCKDRRRAKGKFAAEK